MSIDRSDEAGGGRLLEDILDLLPPEQPLAFGASRRQSGRGAAGPS
jgi:hypothetical protein